MTFWLGLLNIGGISFVLVRHDMPAAMNLPFNSILPIGIIFLSVVVAYMLFILLRKQPLKLGGWELPIPSVWLSLGQIAISSLDGLLASSVLYVLLPSGVQITFPKFVAIFLLAQAAGLLSYIPGGLGVFETIILLMLSQFGEASAVMGSLLLYRLIYYIIPLCVASIILATYELLSRKETLTQAGIVFGRWSSAIVPHFLAFISFVAGAILLFSGSLPAEHERLTWLKDILPLPAIELSHFLSSLIGAGLLILARGLQKRLDAAYHLTVFLFVAAIVLALLKGLEFGQAVILVVMLAALIPCKREFYCKASLTSEHFTPEWIVLIIVVLLCSVWIGVFCHKHIDYSSQLWWQFALNGDAPRFLRATAGAVILIFLYALARLLVPSKHRD